MAVHLNPYISFKSNAREAIEFYHSALGGKLTLNTFKEFHASSDPSEDDLIMHAMLETENGLILMASDTPARIEYKPGKNISISLNGESREEELLRGYFEKLSDGGMVTMPLEKAQWGDLFGMCEDKFGIAWMVSVAGPKG